MRKVALIIAFLQMVLSLFFVITKNYDIANTYILYSIAIFLLWKDEKK